MLSLGIKFHKQQKERGESGLMQIASLQLKVIMGWYGKYRCWA
jgi:hypothetical protein